MSFKEPQDEPSPKLQQLFQRLIHSKLDFVLIGGLAAVIHGVNQTTRDIDLCLICSPEQISELRSILKDLNPIVRNSGVLFISEPRDVSNIVGLSLTTDLGVIDILQRVEGVGDYYDLLKNCEELNLFGGLCHVISLEDLIKSKKAIGRHRDLVTVLELEALQQKKNAEA